MKAYFCEVYFCYQRKFFIELQLRRTLVQHQIIQLQPSCQINSYILLP